MNLSRHSGPSEGPVAESVFIGGMFVKYGKEYADLCAYTGDQAEADRAMKEVAAMNDAVLDGGWDGDWFVRAYDAYGKRLVLKNVKKDRFISSHRDSVCFAGIGVETGEAKKLSTP